MRPLLHQPGGGHVVWPPRALPPGLVGQSCRVLRYSPEVFMVRPRFPVGVGCEENFPGSDYTEDEREFLKAIDRYKRTQRRPHPTWREVLHILLALGYRKQPPGK